MLNKKLISTALLLCTFALNIEAMQPNGQPGVGPASPAWESSSSLNPSSPSSSSSQRTPSSTSSSSSTHPSEPPQSIRPDESAALTQEAEAIRAYRQAISEAPCPTVAVNLSIFNQGQTILNQQQQARLAYQGGGNDGAIARRQCIFCTNDLISPNYPRLMFLPCGHVFHEQCCYPWMAEHHDCPMCRRPVGPGQTRSVAIRTAAELAEAEHAHEHQVIEAHLEHIDVIVDQIKQRYVDEIAAANQGSTRSFRRLLLLININLAVEELMEQQHMEGPALDRAINRLIAICVEIKTWLNAQPAVEVDNGKIFVNFMYPRLVTYLQ